MAVAVVDMVASPLFADFIVPFVFLRIELLVSKYFCSFLYIDFIVLYLVVISRRSEHMHVSLPHIAA